MYTANKKFTLRRKYRKWKRKNMKAAKTLVYEKTGELEDIEMKCRIKKERKRNV